jgi:hypothetical protein
MTSVTIHVVQAFQQEEDGIVAAEPKSCPSAGAARSLAARLAQTHVGVIAWSRTGEPEFGDWQPAVELVRTGQIPDEFDTSGGAD